MVWIKYIWTYTKVGVMTTILLGFSVKSFAGLNDVYFIFYATINGKSGHTGIAVDNYKVIVKDQYDEKGERTYAYDTIKDGTLTYYDLWPLHDNFDANTLGKDHQPKYNKLPTASWEGDITINSLLEKGIPNEQGYPVDGLLRIPNSARNDYEITVFINRQIERNRPFNVWGFNCADFAEIVIEQICECDLQADEQVLFGYATTPNRLYQEAAVLAEVETLKDGSDKAKGSFAMERLIRENEP